MIFGTLMANFSCGTDSFWFIDYDTTCEYEGSGGATRLLRRRLVFRQFRHASESPSHARLKPSYPCQYTGTCNLRNHPKADECSDLWPYLRPSRCRLEARSSRIEYK